MSYLELIRALPDGLKSRVIRVANRIADEKRYDKVGPGAINAGETILYFDLIRDGSRIEAIKLIRSRTGKTAVGCIDLIDEFLIIH